MSSGCACCTKFLVVLVRLFSFFVALFGVALIGALAGPPSLSPRSARGRRRPLHLRPPSLLSRLPPPVYGSYFAANAGAMVLPAGIALGLGAVDLLGGAWIVSCGWRQLCALRAFLLINGLLLLAELAVAILFAVPSQQATIIDKMDLQPTIRQWVEDHIGLTTYILLAAVGVKVAATFFIAMQACSRSANFDEDAYGAAPRRAAGREALLDNAGSASSDIEARAFDRYKEKNAGIYEKYAVKRSADGFRK